MTRNISATVLCTMVISAVVVFAATDALAACLSPECAQLGTCQIIAVRDAIQDGKFPIIVDSDTSPYAEACLYDPDGSTGPLQPIGFPCAVFRYRYAGSCSVSQWAQAIPNPATYCPEDPFDISKGLSISAWAAPGAGDKDTKWYEDDFSVRVLEWQPTADTGGIFYMATTPKVAAHPTPTLLKAGKNLYYSTLLSANCEVAPPLIAQTEYTFTFVDPNGNSHRGYYRTNQSGTEVLELTVDDEPVSASQQWPFRKLRFCAPDPYGLTSITLNFDEPYSCHEWVEATPNSGIVGNSPGWCPWTIKPPGIVVNVCP
jgi:hypothetical protein